jgi:hypothetical protein
MKLRGILLGIAAILSGLTSAPVAAAERVPIIGNDGPDMDACAGIARIFTMEELLSVYEEPDQYARKKGGLPTSMLVWLCEAEGDWQGIVYPTGEFQDLGDCRVSTPVSQPRAYEGPCEYGWVMASNLNLTTQ